jgi:hypothetical protein
MVVYKVSKAVVRTTKLAWRMVLMKRLALAK